MSSFTKTCNQNCVCMNADCSYNHFIIFKNRKVVSKILKENPKIMLNNAEDKGELRRANCTFGYLCNNEMCNYKHHLNFKGRSQLIDLFYYKDDEEIKEVKKEEIKEKKIVVVVINKLELSNNKFNLLNDIEEVEEEDKNQKIIIKTVNNFTKSFVDVVKKSIDDIDFKTQKEFDDMMAQTLTQWGDY